MKVHPLAGKRAQPAMLVNVPKLITALITFAGNHAEHYPIDHGHHRDPHP